MNFLETYNTLSTLLEADAVQQDTQSQRIKQYYNIDYKVPFYWSESGYGYPWFEFESVTHKEYKEHMYSRVPGIYLIVNKITCQAYVGKAVDIAYRMYEHSLRSKKDSRFLHPAMRHHGLAVFKWTVLEVIPEEILAPGEESIVRHWFIEKEQHYIKQLNTYTQVEHYNLTPGGENPPAYFKYENELILQVQQYIDEHPYESANSIAKRFPGIKDGRRVSDINKGNGRFGRVKYRQDLTFPIRKIHQKLSIDRGPELAQVGGSGAALNTPETKFNLQLSRYPWYFIKTVKTDSGDYAFEKLYRSPGSTRQETAQLKPLEVVDYTDLSKVVPYLDDSDYSHYFQKQGFYLTKVKLTEKDFDWWTGQYSATNTSKSIQV
jgi:group I intron endonuclease